MSFPYKKVISDPTYLLEFMKSNIIFPGGLKNTRVYGMPELIAAVTEKNASKYGISIGNPRSATLAGKKSKCGIYYLTNNPDKVSEGLTSFICDYKQGELHYQVLDKRANFCFTTTMNGCTFGIGSRTPTGAVVVSHCNQNLTKPQIKQGGNPVGTNPEKQMILLNQFFGEGKMAGTLTPEEYYVGGKCNATTFGIRVKDDWQFYYQTWAPLGMGKYELQGVFPIKMNSHSI